MELLSRESDVKDSSEKVSSSLHKASLIEDCLFFFSIFILSVIAIEGTLDCVAEIYAKFKHTHASCSVKFVSNSVFLNREVLILL